MGNSFLNKPNYIRIYGHRGARGDIVENSIEGFKYTFALGIKAIEFDVLVSKDNIPVLFHDYTLNTNMVKDSSGKWIDNFDNSNKAHGAISEAFIIIVHPAARAGANFVAVKNI